MAKFPLVNLDNYIAFMVEESVAQDICSYMYIQYGKGGINMAPSALNPSPVVLKCNGCPFREIRTGMYLWRAPHKVMHVSTRGFNYKAVTNFRRECNS